MSLNQPSPPKELSLLEKAKQTVSAATTKVTDAKKAIENKAHKVLPPKVANLALGERTAHRVDPPRPTYPRYKPPSPEGLGIVEPDIRSATTSDNDGDDDRSASSWEAIPPSAAAEGLPRGERRRRGTRVTGNNDGVRPSGVMADLGSHFDSTCPPQVATEITEREEWRESLRRVREQRARGEGVAAARRGRARPVIEKGGSSSSEEGCESKSSDESVNEFADSPYSRSWRHGIGRKMVTVPCDSREELERTYHGTRRMEAREPKEFLEHLGASQYRPVGVVDASSVGGDLSRYRDMGKYFKSGSLGDASREDNIPEDKESA